MAAIVYSLACSENVSYTLSVYTATWLSGVFALQNGLLPAFKSTQQSGVFGGQK